MVFPIAGGNESKGYEISNSLRFNDNDSPALTITPSGAGDRDVFTMSFWVKRANIGSAQRIFTAGTSIGTNNDNLSSLLFETNDTLKFFGEVSGSVSFTLQTNRVFRDPSAWYHIVVAVNTEDGTSSNRIKLYVNGVQESSFSSSSYMSQNTDTFFNATNKHVISYEGSGYLDCYLTEFHYIDGQQLAQTQFGEFDDNGVWIPIKYTGTYGTNGFYLEFQQTGTSANSSGIGADTSGNDNHFTPTNLAATDITEDTCTNNFATLSSIDTHTTSPTLAEGNLDFTAPSGTAFTPARSTIAVSQGKWYMEYKFKAAGGGVGVMTTQSPINDHLRDDSDVRSVYRGWSGYYYGRNNSGGVDDVGGNSVTLSADDIVGIALDLDNGYVYFHKNGTYMNGQDGSTQGNPAGNNGGSGGAANPSSQLLTNQHDGVWAFMAYDLNTANTGRVQCNFGNPVHSISSGNTDGKYGNFEYAPPSGYYALCTKRLAEFG
jgi:hypothetical protein